MTTDQTSILDVIPKGLGSPPYWPFPDFKDDPYWAAPQNKLDPHQKILVISGPARNGNHLIHSMLDNHPDICRLPGEDSFLAAAFYEICKNPEEVKIKLQSTTNVDYILSFSGWGKNKWKDLWQASQKNESTTKVWSGTQDINSQSFAADYQDTIVDIDYPSFYKTLSSRSQDIQLAKTFIDVIFIYLDALRRLDRHFTDKRYNFMIFGSGMRAEMDFLLSRAWPLFKCICPLRPFETFYYSFARGRFKTQDITQELLQEAWEHWYHKAIDYLILHERYPQAVCLVNFNDIVNNPKHMAKTICHFLEINLDPACFEPTLLGRPTKGNSSFPKDEQKRGTYYNSGTQLKLNEQYWPKEYQTIWKHILKNVTH